jgi:hypothetical protein
VKRTVTTEFEDSDGLLFDPERAKKEGLFDELRVWTVTGVYDDPMNTQLIEVRVTEEMMDALQYNLDLGVNVEPGRVTDVVLKLKYRYDYGSAES